MYWLHDPQAFGLVLVALELFVKDYVLTGQEVRRGQKVIFIGLLPVVLFF